MEWTEENSTFNKVDSVLYRAKVNQCYVAIQYSMWEAHVFINGKLRHIFDDPFGDDSLANAMEWVEQDFHQPF